MKKIGARVSRHRILRGLTQFEMAELAGISTNYVSKIERGVAVPTLEVICRIASALETSPSHLLIDVGAGPDRARVKARVRSLLDQAKSLIEQL